MKQFNLDEYLKNPNKKMVTRDGRKVTRIICTDARGSYPVVALIEQYGSDIDFAFTKDGRYLTDEIDGKDLFFVTEKHEGWVNVYKEFETNSTYVGRVCNSEEEAKKKIDVNGIYLATYKIEWEE